MIRLLVVRGELLSRNFIRVCSSAAMLLLLGHLPAVASSLISEQVTSSAAMLEIERQPIEVPELPQLGEPDIYLPEEKPAAAIPAHETRLVIKLKDRRVYVYKQDKLETSYPIAVGKAGWETPTGTYEVMQMLEDPAWQHPWTGEIVPAGPGNPLGSRWIGFWTNGLDFIGFHGTPNEDSVGQAASHGCIRMLNKDVLSLYSQVDIGTPVVVEP